MLSEALAVYAALGAVTALAVHVYVGRMAVAEPMRLCRLCQKKRRTLADLVGEVTVAGGPAGWALALCYIALLWPLIVAAGVGEPFHRCTPPEGDL